MEYFISLRGILVTAFMITGFAAVMLKPRIGIIAIFLLSVLRDGFLHTWFPPIYDLHLPQIVIILTLISWLIHSKEYPLRMNADVILMFLFFIVVCSTRFFAGIPVNDHPLVNENLRIVIIFFLVVQLMRTPKDVKTMLWLFVGMALFLELRAYYFYKTDYMDIALPDYVHINRNGFAGLLAYTLPIAYMLGNASKRRMPRLLGIGTALWCVIGVILTYSRAGLLGMLAGIGALILLEKRKIRLAMIIGLLTLLILPRLSEKYLGRVETIETYQEDASAMGRVATNYAAIEMFKANPFLGVGAGNFNDVFIEYTPVEYLKWVEEGKSIHNIMMQVASETGLLGLVIFLPLMWGGFRNSFVRVPETYPDQAEAVNILRMLRVAFFVAFLTAQFGQGAYHGSLYNLLPFMSVMRLNIVEFRNNKRTQDRAKGADGK